MVKCSDGTLYSGITNNLDNRFKKHSSGKGARYTRSRLPLKLVYFEKLKDQITAMRREWQVKAYSRQKKETLITKKNVEQIARAMIVKDGQILAAHRINAGNLFLPGGHIENDESPEEAIRRELNEELGLDCKPGKFRNLIPHSYREKKTAHREVNYLYEAELPGLAAGSNPESKEAHLEFFWVKNDLKELKRNNLKPALLRKLVSGYKPAKKAAKARKNEKKRDQFTRSVYPAGRTG